MANFSISFEKTISFEGFYSSREDGETIFGIDRKYWPVWEGWKIVDDLKKDNNINSLKIDNNFIQLVKEFYKKNFWDQIDGDIIYNQNIANIIFDSAVNSGVKLAEMLANLSSENYLEDDNDKNCFIMTYRINHIKYLMSCVENNPINIKYLVGWIKRALNN
jgi:lysozyme family protein